MAAIKVKISDLRGRPMSNLRSSLWRALRVRQWRLRHTPHRFRPLVAAETVPAQKAYRVIHQVRECETCIP
jgi:hypothetical protein